MVGYYLQIFKKVFFLTQSCRQQGKDQEDFRNLLDRMADYNCTENKIV